MLLLPLLLKATLLRLASGSYRPFYNGFYYNHIMNDNDNGQDKVDYFNGAKLVVETSKDPVYSYNGANVTLPCHYRYEPDMGPKRKIRIKWSKLRDDYTKEQDVMVAIGKTYVAFGDFKGRAHIRQASRHEASLVISDVRLKDDGKYRCEVIDGLEDESDVVDLRLQGIVFPYQPPRGQYRLNFHEAEQVCRDQGAILANFNQLFQAWSEGLDWCNAGWLAAGAVPPSPCPASPAGVCPSPRASAATARATGTCTALMPSASPPPSKERFSTWTAWLGWRRPSRAARMQGPRSPGWGSSTPPGSSWGWTAAVPAGWQMAVSATPSSRPGPTVAPRSPASAASASPARAGSGSSATRRDKEPGGILLGRRMFPACQCPVLGISKGCFGGDWGEVGWGEVSFCFVLFPSFVFSTSRSAAGTCSCLGWLPAGQCGTVPVVGRVRG
ncbi:PREDICTED: hyaluronan and proteoglycan link protein 3 isoform X1 [Corvus brachyrhynchos]|uniref:hyaluronan and proteoglycan link protein 3 isoform X1 n=1 Tax=Corvus brachyrhynchos TaxID=85066 RepID=UPI0008164760|nr:PREDICTED: hyaluronan and proteoglycan link protein 3 isoform X1 [Corvus brachyrhynchos]